MKLNVYNECLHYYLKTTEKSGLFRKISVFTRQKVLKKFEIPYLEVFITTKCNLHCKHCSSLIPYIENQEHVAFSEFKNNIETLLSKIDRLYRLKLHGGEVFLHPELGKFITYLDNLKKIKSIRLATNGTILPSEKILKLLSDSKVIVQISDYPILTQKVEKLVETLKLYGVKYVQLKGRKWKDMGEIKKRKTNQFEDCSIKRCTSLYHGKIHICSRAAMMEKLGCHFYDGIDINLNKNFLRKEFFNLYEGVHCKACWYCNGDTKLAKEISAGEQLS